MLHCVHKLVANSVCWCKARSLQQVFRAFTLKNNTKQKAETWRDLQIVQIRAAVERTNPEITDNTPDG